MVDARAAALAERAARHAALLVRTDALVERKLLEHLHATEGEPRMSARANGSRQRRCDQMLFAGKGRKLFDMKIYIIRIVY